MASIRWELEDLAFKFLEPESYEELSKKVQQRRRERTDGCPRIDPDAAQSCEHRAECRHRSTAGHAQDVGIGEWIAQQHLHEHAGERERRPGGEGTQRTRQSQLEHQGAGQ